MNPSATTDPAYREKKETLAVYRDWINKADFKLAYYATYTQPHYLSVNVAELRYRKFRSLLRSSLFPVANPPIFREFAVQERCADGKIHWHVLYEEIIPHNGRSKDQEFQRFQWIATKEWIRQFPRTIPSALDFQNIYYLPKLVDYITKEFESGYHNNFDILTF